MLLVDAEEEAAQSSSGTLAMTGIGEREVPVAREVEAGVHVDSGIATAEDVLEGWVVGHEREREERGRDAELPPVSRARVERKVFSRRERGHGDENRDDGSDIRRREPADLGEGEPNPTGQQKTARDRQVELLTQAQRDLVSTRESGDE